MKRSGIRKKYKKLPHPPGKEFVCGESILYLGRNYQLELVKSQLVPVHFCNKFLILETTGSHAREHLQNWYKVRAKAKMFPRLKRHAKTIGVSFGIPKLSSSKYQWGSCTPSDNILLNWRLIKAPMWVIDYVCVHELAHLIEPNHTKRFWNIVRSHIPDYEKAKKLA